MKLDIKKILKTSEFATSVKFILSAILVCMTYFTTHSLKYVVFGLAELALIVLIYNLLIEKSKWLRILAEPILFIFNAQMLVLYFGNSFTTITMLKNIKFIQDLGGKLVPYTVGTIFVLALTFMPVKPLFKNIDKRLLGSAICALLFVEVFVNTNYKQYSPVQSLTTVILDQIHLEHIQHAATDPEEALKLFHKNSVENGIKKPADLPEKPNIIVIFTEGLSYNVISDEREIMPSVQEFEKSCISFKNYYNHTFPTLRGVQGQLFSGYKQDDDNAGNNLVSVQSVLKEQGYKTAFINTEPFNEEFTLFQEHLGFDELLSDPDHVSGYADGMTDLESYTFLKSTAHQLAKGDQPFFLGIYTFGTHVSFDSMEYKFGDGTSDELNKFYNCGKMFENFIEDFNNSELADNTILIFTADHATYADQSFTKAFPDYERICTDSDVIPFFIYYKGIEPQEIDVQGRNSLCFAPTVLDFLDLDVNTENYFLGTSLFDENAGSIYDHVFFDVAYLISTDKGQLRFLYEQEKDEFLSGVMAYYTALGVENK